MATLRSVAMTTVEGTSRQLGPIILSALYSRGEQSLPCIVYLFPLSQITEKFHDSGQATRLNKNVFRLRSLYNEYNQRITTFIN